MQSCKERMAGYPQVNNRRYYELLGIKREDSANVIKKAYLKLARLYHPDKNPDAKDNEKVSLLPSQSHSKILIQFIWKV